MLPDGNGFALQPFVDGVEQTVVQSYTLVEGGPAQGNYSLWGTVDGITLVAFVQNMNTLEIYQGAISAEPLVGIEEADARPALDLYPNPSTGSITLRSGEAGPADVTVHDATGKTVFGTRLLLGQGTSIIDLGGLNSGLYHVRVNSGGHIATRTIHLMTPR
jgi:hypothetical protein